MKGYSTRAVADLLGMPQETIRGYARSGVLSPERDPRGHYHFSFQDIIILRTAKELYQASIMPGKISKVLTQLKRDLPTRKSLTSLRISGQGGEVVIHDDDKVYNPDSGQLHFDLSIAELAGSVAPLARKAAQEAQSNTNNLTSDDWFDLGIDLEVVSPQDAPAAYLRAIELDPTHSDAHINLGRLYQEAGEFPRAEEHYKQAMQLEPDNGLAAFNLGTLLEDMGRIHEAIEIYGKASSLADAHYNLSRLYELVGRHAEALQHLKTYRALMDPT
jgi:tetratricopeptide (TPR) repeat protein